MSASRAVILAAGNGKRMGRLTVDRPKTMLDVDGRALIDRELDALAAWGIFDVTIVVGYHHERPRGHLGSAGRFIENARYKETNSLYSLWLARETLEDGGVVMKSDILGATPLIAKLNERTS